MATARAHVPFIALLALTACGLTTSSTTDAETPPDLRAHVPARIARGGTSRVEVRDLHTNEPLRAFSARGEGVDVLETAMGVVRFRAGAVGAAVVVLSNDRFEAFERISVTVVEPTGVLVRGRALSDVPFGRPLACLAGGRVTVTLELVGDSGGVADEAATLAPLGAHAVVTTSLPTRDVATASVVLECGLGDGSLGFVSGGEPHTQSFPGVSTPDSIILATDAPEPDPRRFGRAFCFEAHAGNRLLLTDEWSFSSPAVAPDLAKWSDPPGCVWLYDAVGGPFPVTVAVGGFVETFTVQVP